MTSTSSLFHLRSSFRQTVTACVVLTMYFPCVATFVVMLRELGVRGMLKAAAIMVGTSLVVGGLLNLAFRTLS